MSTTRSMGIFVILSVLASGFPSHAQSSNNLFSTTPLGLGSCTFNSESLCKVNVVALEENLQVQRLTRLRFKDFHICRNSELQLDRDGITALRSHLENLQNFSENNRSQTANSALEIRGRARKALKEFAGHLDELELRFQSSALDRRDLERLLVFNQELASAFKSNFKYPVDEDQNIPQALGSLLENHAPVIGVRPQDRACNLDPRGPIGISYSDGRTVQLHNPEQSTFWSRPQNISTKNIAFGYDRGHQVNYSRLSYQYLSPKDGYGINPGFNVRGSDGAEYKIRLGPEVRTGSFNSRMVHALGYPVLQIDYVKSFQTLFDLKLLREFNSRKSLGFNLTLFRQTLRRFELQQVYDPFDYIESGILKSGERLSSGELKSRLILPGKQPADFDKQDSYDSNFAHQVRSLIWKEVSIEKKDDNWEALGAWFYEGLHHENRRELRGFGVLAAWLGIYDIRWENTRIFKVKERRGRQTVETLKHVISDLGSGLGGSGGLLTNSIAEVNDISRSFFHLLYGYIDLTGQIQPWSGQQDIYPAPVPRFIPIFTKYSSILPNVAFNRADFEDTLWMAQYILQITPHQIRQAAEVSGFSPGETQILIERLTSRQNNLRRELYLEGARIH